MSCREWNELQLNNDVIRREFDRSKMNIRVIIGHSSQVEKFSELIWSEMTHINDVIYIHVYLFRCTCSLSITWCSDFASVFCFEISFQNLLLGSNVFKVKSSPINFSLLIACVLLN